MVAEARVNYSSYQRPDLYVVDRPQERGRILQFPGNKQNIQESVLSPAEDISFEEDFSDIARLQAEFDLAIQNYLDSSFETTKEDLLTRSYNPVVDRWHVEKLLKAGNEKELVGFRNEARANMATNIMERLRAQESYGEFGIRGDELYSIDFPEKSFSEVIRFGTEYRAGLGSREQIREGELGELAGWEYIKSVMSDSETPLETTIYSLSPHGLVEKTNYDAWFVDRYRLSENEKEERYVKRTRTAVNWDYKDYKKTALDLDPHFFDDYDGRALDAWFLSHPIKKNEDIIAFDLAQAQTGMQKEKFTAIYLHPSLQRLLGRYENILFAEKVDWVALALSFNSILNCVDELEKLPVNANGKSVSKKDNTRMKTVVDNIVHMDEFSFMAAVSFMGRQDVRTRTGGGCPANKGIKLGGFGAASIITNPFDILSNSVAKFGLKKKIERDYSFNKKADCVVCNKKNVMCGPCDICESCDTKIQEENQNEEINLGEGLFEELPMAA